jgi:hypothetical protein
MGFEIKDILPYLSLVVSAISTLIALRATSIAWKAVTRNLRPVLVFVRDDKVWFVTNVGNGPALDVHLAQKAQDGDTWQTPVLRLAPLPKDGETELPSGAAFFAVTYTDAEGESYSTTCTGYRNQVQKGRVFETPDEKQITLYANLPRDSRS